MADAVLPPSSTRAAAEAGRSQCIDWYHEGQTRLVEANGVRIEVRFVGRKGRRARIAIVAPPGAAFRDAERGRESNRSTLVEAT